MRKEILLSFILLFSAIPHAIEYQAKLVGPDEHGINDTLTMTFRLYDSLTGGNLLWEETHENVQVIRGLFNVRLGEIVPFDTLSFDTTYYLEVEVNEEILAPRKAFVTVPYAIRAAIADSLKGFPGNAIQSIIPNWGLLSSGTDTLTLAVDSTALDERYVEEGEPGSISNVMIQERAVTSTHLLDSTIIWYDMQPITSDSIISYGGITLRYTAAEDISRGDAVYIYSPLPGFGNFIEVIVTNSLTEELTNFQVRLTLTPEDTAFWNNEPSLSGDDLRFYEAGEERPYWIQYFSHSVDSAVIWIKLNTIPSSGSDTLIMYFNNPSASPHSNPDSTFQLFDNFEDTGGSYYNDDGCLIIREWYGSCHSGGCMTGPNFTSPGAEGSSWGAGLYDRCQANDYREMHRNFTADPPITVEFYRKARLTPRHYSGCPNNHIRFALKIQRQSGSNLLTIENVDIWEDNDFITDWEPLSANLSTSYTDLRFFIELQPYNIAAGLPGYIYIDNLVIRKYASTEPTVTLGEGGKAGLRRAYATDVNVARRFLGFALNDADEGEDVDVRITGVVELPFTLTTGMDYYLSDTPGQISNSPGTNFKLTGTAIDSSRFLIIR